MSIPVSRTDLKEWCLRKLGKPVIEINVDDDQMEDRIDEALQFYQEYHFDGTEKVYEKYQLTTDDITNKYIYIPDLTSPSSNNAYTGITKIFPGTGTSVGMWDVRYQMRLNDITTFGSGLGGYDMLSYQMRMKNLAMIQELLVGKIPIRHNRHGNKLYLDWEWASDAVAGEHIIIEAFKVIDPEVYVDVYNDMFLKQYVTALFKEQWGLNLSKFEGVQMVGGVTLNGRVILDEARTDIDKLREEMSLKFELPVDFMMA
ncbi:MAG TPA: hypothetical protein HPP54_10605 [Nitrospinae bacterium]|nr:hypothetical protein [Nitrospinota bacterium]